jgi:hypothetical protein
MSSFHWSRAIGGWLAGCGAATAVYGGAGLVGSMTASGVDIITMLGATIAALPLLFLAFLVICMVTAIPAALVIWVSEALGIRSMLFFAGGGAVIGWVSATLFLGVSLAMHLGAGWIFPLAGFAAGSAYWYVAGRYTGRDHQLDTNSSH